MRTIAYFPIICGFPGVGKSFLHGLGPSALKEVTGGYCEELFDADSSSFPKSHFPENYLHYIQGNISRNPRSIQMCSTHAFVLAGLSQRQIVHALVYPKRELKEEYLARYKERGNPQTFIDLLDAKWDDFISDIERHVRHNPETCFPVVLDAGEYLKDEMEAITQQAFRLFPEEGYEKVADVESSVAEAAETEKSE